MAPIAISGPNSREYCTVLRYHKPNTALLSEKITHANAESRARLATRIDRGGAAGVWDQWVYPAAPPRSRTQAHRARNWPRGLIPCTRAGGGSSRAEHPRAFGTILRYLSNSFCIRDAAGPAGTGHCMCRSRLVTPSPKSQHDSGRRMDLQNTTPPVRRFFLARVRCTRPPRVL